jgi:hypothetical protein
MLWCGFHYFILGRSIVILLCLIRCFFRIREFGYIISSNYFCLKLFFSFWDSITCVVGCLILSHRSLRLYLLFNFFSSLLCRVGNFYCLYLSSLTLYSVNSDMLSSSIFISVTIFFISRIFIWLYF